MATKSDKTGKIRTNFLLYKGLAGLVGSLVIDVDALRRRPRPATAIY
jgi:hypothetical protein